MTTTAAIIYTIDVPAHVWLAVRRGRVTGLVRRISEALYREETRVGGPRPAVVAAWRRERARYLELAS